MEFEVSIRPSAEKPLLEGSGTLGDVTVIMGRPRTGKSLFLRYLFALLSEDYELAIACPLNKSLITADGQG